MKVREYLTESVDSKTRRFVLKAIGQRSQGKMGKVTVSKRGNALDFVFPSNEYDLIVFLTDIIDSMKGAWFEQETKGDKITFTVYLPDEGNKSVKQFMKLGM